jgi:hypothetical protein
MAEEMKGRVVDGKGKAAELDGGYFGGYVKPANQKETHSDTDHGRPVAIELSRAKPALRQRAMILFSSFIRASCLKVPRITGQGEPS